MSIFRRNNYNTKRAVEDGGLAALLRTYGSVGGANARVEMLAKQKLADAARKNTPSIMSRIYAPTTLDIAPLPFEAGNNAQASMVERIYEPSKNIGKDK